MSLTLLGVILGVLLLLLIVGAVLTFSGGGASAEARRQAEVSSNLRNLVVAQRERAAGRAKGQSADRLPDANLALAAAAEGDLTRKKVVASSRMDLTKLMRYAKWSLTPMQFRAIQLFATITLVIPAYLHCSNFIVILAAFLGPRIPMSMLRSAVNRRFEAFDKDYPVLLLSYVSLLKTGMSTIGGLEAAAKGLDQDSVVRIEVELLVERLRLGLTEEQAISAFGENVAHPELELFVQSLILSKRVGGQLSGTLERLARQVRKRQQFRKQAVAAVGMERSSLKMIAVIMGLLMLYLGWSAPELVFPAFKHALGKKVFECGLMLIVIGFYWSNRVTDVKV